MKKIYLFCTSAMSSSMLAKMMQEYADANGLAAHIEAFPTTNIDETLEHDLPDCMLLSPQVKHLYNDIKERYGEKTPVGMIDRADYGTMNAERVLKYSILLMKQFANASCCY